MFRFRYEKDRVGSALHHLYVVAGMHTLPEVAFFFLQRTYSNGFRGPLRQGYFRYKWILNINVRWAVISSTLKPCIPSEGTYPGY